MLNQNQVLKLQKAIEKMGIDNAMLSQISELYEKSQDDAFLMTLIMLATLRLKLQNKWSEKETASFLTEMATSYYEAFVSYETRVN